MRGFFFVLFVCLFVCLFCQIDLRDDPKTLARLLYMKEKPLTYEHGVKLAKAVQSDLDLI